MKTKFSMALAIGAMTFSAASSPVLMAGKAQSLEPVVSESKGGSKDIIKRVVEPHWCVNIPTVGPVGTTCP